MNKEQVQNIQKDIIKEALPGVVFDGWNWEAIEGAAEKTKHGKDSAAAVFPDRIVDVLDGFAQIADEEMLKQLEKQDPESLRIRDRIKEGVLARLEWLQAHKEAVRASVSFWAIPSRKLRASKMVWRTADAIWDWAGDTSQDYNRYTKRGLLSGILVSTLLVWLDDETENMNITKDFLNRRIENVLTVGQFIGRFKKAS